MTSILSRLDQLEQAKALVAQDPIYFPQIAKGVLPIAQDPDIILRQWVVEFLILTFSSDRLSSDKKQNVALDCLATLLLLLKESDFKLLKSAIQLSAMLYPFVFKHVAQNPQDMESWRHLSAVKSLVLAHWDSPHRGLRGCSLKFVQKVIIVQSQGTKDPRSDVSLALVTSNHPLLKDHELTAESHGLLDRMCGLLEDETHPGLLTACINCLCVLSKTRTVLMSKVVNAMLNFDSSRLRKSHTDAMKLKLQLRFVEKSVKICFTHILKSNTAGSLGPKIQQYLAEQQQRISEEPNRKRHAADSVEATNKRLRTEVDSRSTPVPSVLSMAPLPEGPVSLATIFNLANDNSLANFDVQQLPVNLVRQIALATLLSINEEQLNASAEVVKARYSVAATRSAVPTNSPPEDPHGNLEEIKTLSSDLKLDPVKPLSLRDVSFEMPEPRLLNKETSKIHFDAAIARIFIAADSTRNPVVSNTSTQRRTGLEKVIGSSWGKESWTALITRLPTRGLSGLTKTSLDEPSMSNLLRQQYYLFVSTNFKERLDFCINWLNEEWYGMRLNIQDISDGEISETQYTKWSLKVLDGLVPQIQGKDTTLLLRLLSDLPELSSAHIDRIKTLCLDPDRAKFGFTILQYLISFRPPVETICLDLIQQLWQDESDKTHSEKLLRRFRPELFQQASEE